MPPPTPSAARPGRGCCTGSASMRTAPVHGFMDRHGARAVTAGRLVAGIRTKLAVVSGSTRMPFHRYVVADALGAAVWAVAVGLIGYLFAGSVAHLTEQFSDASHYLAVAAFAIVGGAV